MGDAQQVLVRRPIIRPSYEGEAGTAAYSTTRTVARKREKRGRARRGWGGITGAGGCFLRCGYVWRAELLCFKRLLVGTSQYRMVTSTHTIDKGGHQARPTSLNCTRTESTIVPPAYPHRKPAVSPTLSPFLAVSASSSRPSKPARPLKPSHPERATKAPALEHARTPTRKHIRCAH